MISELFDGLTLTAGAVVVGALIGLFFLMGRG